MTQVQADANHLSTLEWRSAGRPASGIAGARRTVRSTSASTSRRGSWATRGSLGRPLGAPGRGTAPGAARPRAQQEPAHRGRRAHTLAAGGAQGRRCPAGGRRLRHGLLGAQLPPALPARHPQDRQVVHQRPAARQQPVQHLAGADRAGRRAGPRRRRRGHRSARPARVAAPHALGLRPGLPLRPPADGSRPDGPHVRRRGHATALQGVMVTGTPGAMRPASQRML
jgi:hypothetical protein